MCVCVWLCECMYVGICMRLHMCYSGTWMYVYNDVDVVVCVLLYVCEWM